MKKCVMFVLIAFALSGCGAEETFETIADEFVQSAAAPLREVILELPEEAVLPASESDAGTLYLCDGYEISVQTLPAGDLEASVYQITGFSKDRVEVISTQPGTYRRYDLVWSTLGEQGDQVGRAAILDDGSYHYVLSVLAEANRAGEFEQVFRELFESYALG